MQKSQCSQRKIHFNSGKTFYVDFNSKNINKPINSFGFSKISEGQSPYLSSQISQCQLYRSNAHYPCQIKNNDMMFTQEEADCKQLFFYRSHQIGEMNQNSKSDKKNGYQNTQKAHCKMTKSLKKHKIFGTINDQRNGNKRSHTNLKKIEDSLPFQKLENNEKRIKFEQSTNYSKKICFSRRNQSKTSQQIPSYERPLNILNYKNQPDKMITSSQPLSRYQTYVSFNSRTMPSPTERLNFIEQIQSKHIIGMHESKTSLVPLVQFQSNKNNNEMQGSSNQKQSKNVTRQLQISNKKIKLSHKNHELAFCEQSTIKAGGQKKEEKISNHDTSISNIEQDNSVSRYFDPDDDLLPLLNRVSYKNVQIQSRPYEKPDEIVTHNIFMDFQKAPSTPILNKRQSRQIVHYDCTLAKIESKKENVNVDNKHSFKDMAAKIMNKVPMGLILVTIILLIVQIAE